MFGRGADVMQKGDASSSTAQPAAAAAPLPPPSGVHSHISFSFLVFFEWSNSSVIGDCSVIVVLSVSLSLQ